MRRTKLIVLLLVVVMAVATMPAIAVKEAQAAPIVGASRTPTISAYYTPTYPERYQTYTVYGYLKWSGNPLPYKYLKVYYHFAGQTSWTYLKTVKTDANGKYSFSSYTSVARVYWKISFAGDSVYYPKTAYCTVYTSYRSTTLSIYSSPTNPSKYQTYTVYGYLKGMNINWSPLPYKYLKVYYHFAGQTSWTYLKTVKTDANGKYSFSSSSGASRVYWMVTFAGDSVYTSKTTAFTVYIGVQCNHVDIIIYHPANTPCNTCAMMMGTLGPYYANNPYVTISMRDAPSNSVVGRVRETGQTQAFEWGNVPQIEAWTNSILTCK